LHPAGAVSKWVRGETLARGCHALSSIPISDELETFLKARLSSPDQIDIVMLLLGDPSRSWTAPEVAAAVRAAPESTAMRLFLLASGGLIAFEPSSVPRYRYAPTDPDTDRLLRELATIYETDRAALLRTIEAPADPLRSFADAFKLKK
jgi:hypothetical protein